MWTGLQTQSSAGNYRRSNQRTNDGSWTQSETDLKPHQKTTEARKAKEFFDPNFIPFAGDFFTKNLSS